MTMLIYYYVLFTISFQFVLCYTNKQFTILNPDISNEFICNGHESSKTFKENLKNTSWEPETMEPEIYRFPTIRSTVSILKDPLIEFETIILQVLYGRKIGTQSTTTDKSKESEISEKYVDKLAHSPSGQIMRATTFNNKSAVNLPFGEFIHRDHAVLNITRDNMQTAVDAFAIFLSGSIDDILNLPSTYVLDSARTIAMMRIPGEKLAATWWVVKGSTPTNKITRETLERYRTLFKHVSGKEMSRLNLLDDKILSYIGTHPDLNRHQVGVVASRYLQLNSNWTQAKYLNLMNNLLCGVPMVRMRQIPKNTYLRLTNQLFFHIRACDPLQRKFYLQMMMRTQALGKPYSWTARDVFRLGLLLAELNGPSLSTINPEAMAGITSKVILEMPIKSLNYITEMQMRYMEPKVLNIMAKKMLSHYKQNYINNGCKIISVYTLWHIILYIL